jgi:hypothetical protein
MSLTDTCIFEDVIYVNVTIQTFLMMLSMSTLQCRHFVHELRSLYIIIIEIKCILSNFRTGFRTEAMQPCRQCHEVTHMQQVDTTGVPDFACVVCV